ncbi:MAG: hypothetical protein ABSE99_17215 [Terracidiphilus sp.]
MATKPKTKERSFEHYARAIQTDIANLGKEVRDGFQSIRKDMDAGFLNVRRQMDDIRDDVGRMNGIMVSKADLESTVRYELDTSPFAKEAEVKGLRERLLRVEKKLGMKTAA